MIRIPRSIAFALAIALGIFNQAHAQIAAPASRLRPMDTVRYVDLDGGSDAADGQSSSTPWRTLDKVRSALFPGSSTSSESIRVLVILAGTSGGSNATSTGTDQFTYDASARTAYVPATQTWSGVETAIAFRSWTEADGARPSSGKIARPLLRADTPCAAGMTQLGTSVAYKINTALTGSPALLGSVMFKPGQLGTLDADGASKVHMRLIGQGTSSEATIETDLVAAGAGTAYYRTTNSCIYVNTSGLTGGTTGTNYAWTLDQVTANFAKIRPIGFTYVGVENVDTAWGERGLVVFDSLAAEIYGCRAYEHGVHGIHFSYTNYPLRNITVDGCEVYGLGNSATGFSMLAATGESGNLDASGIRFTNNRVRRYMLQNPSGSRYTSAQYPIVPIDIGTANATNRGKVLDALVKGCTIEDVSAAKSMTTRGEPIMVTRCAVPGDRTLHDTYPVRIENCDIRTLGTWLIYQGTNYGDYAVSYKNCRVSASAPDATLYSWGVRGQIIFYTPATSGTTQYVGIFGGTQWRMDVGAGDAANTFPGFTPNNNSGAGAGLRHYLTARDSDISIVSVAQGTAPVFEQNSTSDAANKVLFLDVQRCRVGNVTPLGMALTKTQLVGRDLPASGNTSRVFLGNTYFNIQQTDFSGANATYANFVTNVDTLATLDLVNSEPRPDLAPTSIITPWIRSRF